MNRLFCYLLVLLSAGNSRGAKFYIGGLFPNNVADVQDRLRLGVYPEMAAQLAVLQVNQAGLLAAHNVSLELLSFGTSCDQDAAVYAYLKLTSKIGKILLYSETSDRGHSKRGQTS